MFVFIFAICKLFVINIICKLFVINIICKLFVINIICKLFVYLSSVSYNSTVLKSFFKWCI